MLGTFQSENAHRSFKPKRQLSTHLRLSINQPHGKREANARRSICIRWTIQRAAAQTHLCDEMELFARLLLLFLARLVCPLVPNSLRRKELHAWISDERRRCKQTNKTLGRTKRQQAPRGERRRPSVLALLPAMHCSCRQCERTGGQCAQQRTRHLTRQASR